MPLEKDEAEGMTVNERLFAAGQLGAFDDAVAHHDVARLRGLLASVYLDERNISSIIERVLDPAWPVGVEAVRRFAPSDWQEATKVLDQLTLPLLDGPERALDRARVQMALVKLAAGDLAKLRRWADQAAVDWRDVLVAAGMANANWRDVLARDGFMVPGGGNAERG